MVDREVVVDCVEAACVDLEICQVRDPELHLAQVIWVLLYDLGELSLKDGHVALLELARIAEGHEGELDPWVMLSEELLTLPHRAEHFDKEGLGHDKLDVVVPLVVH